jgi:NAD(P)-dependent dehydrogenase (short-subunit alcohol dehydrogenase family)
MVNLTGKVAIVTGSASGIGRTTALTLASAGAAVVIADLNLEGAQATAEDIVSRGGKAIAVKVDISDEAQVAAMVDAAVAEYGRLDVLHANAALTAPQVMLNDKGIADLDPVVFARVLGINVIGTALTAKHASAQMTRNGGGVIIFTTSQESVLGEQVRSMYSASKAAIESIMRDTATQFGPNGIRAISVSPGVILTEGARAAVPEEQITGLIRHNLIPRIGEPEDIANTVAFLASDEAGYITGISIAVDGGMLQHFPNLAEQREAETPAS